MNSLIDAPSKHAGSRVGARNSGPSAVRVDARGRIVRASSAAAALLGYRPQDLAGRGLDELAAEDWRAAVNVALSRMQQGAAGPFELMLVGRSGRLTMMEMASQPSPPESESEGEAAVVLLWSEGRQRRHTSASGPADELEVGRLADGALRTLESLRAGISSDLADEVASMMTMARYLIEDAGQRLMQSSIHATVESLHLAGERLRAATARVHEIAGELRPRVFDDLGLLAALAWLVRAFSKDQRGVVVSPRITVHDGAIPQALRLTVFRVVQAALANVASHARASAVRLLLETVDGELRLTIEDNGVGFDVERWQQGRIAPAGCGLLMIRRWIESSGGTCSIESTPRHGARILALWPLPPPADAEPAGDAGPGHGSAPELPPAD